MYYDNKIKSKSVSYSKYNYASFANGINTDYDEKLLPVRYATTTYNYCYQNGALKTGLGVKDLELCYDFDDRTKIKKIVMPDGVDALATYTFVCYDTYYNVPFDTLLVYGSDKDVYAYTIYTKPDNKIKLGLSLQSIPMVANYNLNGEDCVIIATEEDGMYIWDGLSKVKKIEDAPVITSMCMHYERMYATSGGDRRTIYFSDDLDPTNWSQSLTEGGFINLMDERGMSNKVISFNDSLYVFREYGIDRIVAYADQTDFQVIPLFTSSTKIYTDTVKVCGDRIMFLAADGIYYFSGLTTKKYDLKLNSLFEKNYNDNAKASYFNGRYYLACRLIMDDDIVGCEEGEYDNNVLLEVDIRTGEINILRGYDIINVQTLNTKIESKLVVCIKSGDSYKVGEVGKIGSVFGEPTTKVWKSPMTSFDYSMNYKLLKSITLSSDSDVDVVVRTENQTRRYSINGGKKISTINANIKAKELAIDFVSNDAEVNISNPQIIVGRV